MRHAWIINDILWAMDKKPSKSKKREWLRRYVPAEILGTITALIGAWGVYAHGHSYVTATAAGWFGEGVGFYGYFIITELLANSRRYRQHSLVKRVSLAIGAASTNLLVEFAPAEVLDNFIIRPFFMYLAPHYIHPYPIGFLAGKFGADIIFYAFAILGYEARKRWLKR
ncbi:MAG TPA: hypothetical protein VHC21_04600 [Candidatus Saccharimonadales bacterium]|nr:hypothetical protein [Candidatus Saccharimonadales bacterium]